MRQIIRAGWVAALAAGIWLTVPAGAQQTWDETGPDWTVPDVPDVSEVSPAVARARSLAKTTALDMGATEAEAEQAAFVVPENLDAWKSPLQEAFEEHQGETPTDFDPTVKPPRTVAKSLLVLPKAAPKAIATGKRVLGWHPYWATMTDIQNYQYTNLTTIAYFSYAVNSTNGGYDSIGSWNTSPVVEWAHSNGVKVVLTATLFGDTATHRLLTNVTARNALIGNLATVVSNRGGDGVCIDFEGVGSWTGATTNLTAFLSNLTARFHQDLPGSEVSVALPSVDWYANYAVSNLDKAGLDCAIIMGYDYYYSGSATPGPVAPLYSSAQWFGASSWCSVNYSMNYYLGKGISTNKLMLGVPYYGRRWAAASTNLGAASLGSSYSAALTYGQCESAAATYGKKWDDNGSVPYYVYVSNSTAYQCFYDDVSSLGMKYDLSNSKGMGGIGIWNLTQGTGQTALWNLIDEKFGADATPPIDTGGGETGGSSATAAWTNRTSAHVGNFYGVASRAGLHVASGASGAIYTSTNGIDWIARSSGKSGLLMNVNGDGPLWVVVGDGGAIVTSTNGLDWTSRTSPTNALFRGVAYGNGIYVACGDGGAIVRSTDGATWTAVSSGTNLSLQGVGYGMDFVNSGDTNQVPTENPLFVVVGANGLILTSTNGVSWTQRTSGTTVYISDVMYGNGYYVAVGNTRILRSSDGVDWSFATNSAYLYRAAYCSGLFKATGKSGAIWSSTDGLTWEAETSGTTNDIRGISYAEDQFVAVGHNGTILTKGTMGAVAEGGGETGGGEGETGGGTEPIGTPDETGLPQVAAAQPTGPLSGVVVFTSAGHGFGADSNLTSWIPERPLLNAVNEDTGNIDQMNRFAEAAWKAGATVVPFRPLGYQTNEVVLDNMDTNSSSRGQVTFGGTWYNSTQTIFYGNVGDAVPYRYAAISTNGSTSWASYRPNLPEEGDYPVYTWVRHGSDRADQLYRVYHSGGVTDVRVNHRDVGCGWVWLGNYHFAAGTNGCVNIGNYAPGGAEGSSVFADAIRFGNGRGNESRGAAGISGFESELESARFWTIKSMGQGMDATLYDLAGYDDRSDNIGQPARMAAYMCRSNDAARWQRVYVGFHSNAGDGTGRGSIGLYDTRIQSSYPTTYYASQTNLAAALARQCNEDMRAGTNSVIPSWSTRTTYLYGSAYGEIYNSSVFLKMDTTINEVAFHDNTNDCVVLRTPAGREWLARASVRGLIKHLAGYYASGIVNTNAPDRPTSLKAVNSGSGQVTVSWAMPARGAASGGLPQGFVLYTSTDGQGFGNPIAVPGASATNKVITNLNAGATIFFKVCATNAGGESFDSAVAGARVTAGGAKAGVLVVDGFTRNDAGLTPTRNVTNRTGSISYANVSLVRPRMINGFDYVKDHGLALAAAGQTFDYVGSALVTSALLTNYAKVVWMLGEESTVDETFGSAEQAAVTNYLGQGGRLFVSGSEIGWDLGRSGVSSAADVNFFTNALRAVYSADSSGTGSATGTSAGFLSGVSMAFNYTNLLSQVYAANYPDVLRVGSGAVTAAVYGTSASGTSGAIIQYSNATYRTIVMGFPFETITNADTRATVMTAAMQFLGDSVSPGAIKVTLSPAAVTNAARWFVNGTTNLSGAARTGLNPGTYQVTYGAVSGYIAPAATSVVVTAGATNVLTGTYASASGSLTVTLTPSTAVADGRWSIDGGAVWRTSGTTLSNLTNGTYAVTFQDIDSHTTPAATNVTIAGGAVSITGTYVALVGDLTVTLTPAAAVSGGAQWSVDGGSTWYDSGATASNLLAGRQYFTFKAVSNYSVPSTTYTTVYSGSNTVRSYAYTALPGSIAVTLAPAGAVAAGAMWSLDGGTNWNESGATVVDLAIKTYSLSFLAVDGYAAPATTNYALSAGEAASFTKTYADLPGALTVNLTPASAQWSLDGGSSWIAAGVTTNLAAGGYTVTFGPLTGYATPAATNVTVVSGATGTVARTYVLQPVGANCIASQGFDGADVHPWSWSAVNLNNSGLATNDSFGAVVATNADKVLSGAWAARMNGSTNGAVNPAIVFANMDISAYTNVTLTVPFAATGPDSGDDLYVGVSYDGGATWSPSAFGTEIADGYSSLSLDYGTLVDTNRQPQGTPYVLAIDDSRTQLMARVVFYDASSNNTNDFYFVDEIQLTGQTGSVPVVSSALSVTLQPAEAVAAGALWRVDGGAWRASGAVATGLTAGAHTVSFGAATGWIAPDDVATATTNGTTNSFAATYVAVPDTNSVTLIDEPFDAALTNAPAGWTFSGVTNYSATYYGRAVPSVKFDSDGDYVVTPTFSHGTNVSFWMRAVTAAGTGTFVVAQYSGGSWSTLGVVTNPSNVGTTYVFDLAETVTQLKFTWNKTYSNIALDDVIVTGVTSDPTADSDGDGMPDDYENQYFGGSTNGVPAGDDDGDGRSNYDEFIAGTDPKTNSSVLALAPYATNQTATANLIFRWPSVTGRVYSIWRATNAAGPYTQHVGNLSATAPTNGYTNAAPTDLGAYFYGIGVQRAP